MRRDDELNDEVLAEALAAYEAECAGGKEPPDVDAFCARWPQAGPGLRSALAMHRDLVGLDRAVGPAQQHELPPRFGRYTIVAEIGRGGMAPVFRARDEELGREVALKVLLPDAVQGESRRVRFVREARALARLHHGNVVPIHDVGSDGAYAWFAMELCERSLADEPLPASAERWKRVVRFGIEAAAGLAHAHAAGVLHRDVKPSNLLVAAGGKVKVADFGLARMGDDGSLTATGEVVGTLRYAAPEQLRGGPLTPATDVYGLGATLWHLATGAPPAVRLDEKPAGGGAEMPRALRRVLERALLVDPRARHRGMDDLAADLRAVAEGRATATTRRRRRLAAGVAAACAAALAAAVLIVPARHGRRRLQNHKAWSIWLGTEDDWTAEKPVRHLRKAGLVGALPVEEVDVWTTGPYSARIEEGGWLVLRKGAEVVAELALQREFYSDLSKWRPVMPPYDADGDGAPEMVLRGEGRQVTIVKWEPVVQAALGGWTMRTDSGISYGAPVVADWDGDGKTEILLTDAGLDMSNESAEGYASFYALDPETGERRAVQRLSGIGRSTPQFLRDASGRVRETYVDTEPGRHGGASGGLWRLSPARAPELIPLASTGTGLTWPVFTDVDGDGEEEIIIGTMTGRVICVSRTNPEPPIWTLHPDGSTWAYLSYPILSEQDGRPGSEVCLSTPKQFVCLRTALGLSDEERVVWSVPLAAGCVARPTDVGDLDGDGRSDFACGAGRGGASVWVVSGGWERPLALEVPVEALPPVDLSAPNPFVAARVLTVPDGDGTIVVAATMLGWVVAWRLAPAAAPPGSGSGRVTYAATPLWHYQAAGTIIGSPILVGEDVAFADFGGWVMRLGLRDGVARWGYRAKFRIGMTPLLLAAPAGPDAKPALVFGDSGGFVYKVPF